MKTNFLTLLERILFETTVNKTILTPTTTNFLIYENHNFGGNTFYPNIWIKVMYPSDWEVDDEASNSIEIMPISEMDKFRKLMIPGAGVGLTVYTTSHKNLTQYLNYQPPDFTVRYSKDFTLEDGTQAAVLAFHSNTEMRPDSRTTTMYALKNGTLYEVTYSAHSGLYNDYLPAAKKNN